MDSTRDASDETPVLGSARAGIRLELALRTTDPLENREDPFLPLDESGRFGTILLGRLAMGDDATLRHLALKIQRSSYRPLQPGLPQAQVTNLEVEELWRRERDHLLKLNGAASSGVVSFFDLGEDLFRSRPITFCRTTRKYFHPPCPSCASLLEDCRDDGLLRDLGLPAYSESAVRYLYCRTCAASSDGENPIVLYTASPSEEEHPKRNAVVRRRGELYRDMALLVHSSPSPEAQKRLERLFPCFSCEYKDACYPSKAGDTQPIEAEARLVAVSYQEFHMLPMEALELHFDELADLLGGASWEDVKRTVLEQAPPGRSKLLAELDPGLSSPFQWIHQKSTGGGFSVEVLRLKLIAFTQLSRGLRAYHERCRMAHLDLNPASVLVQVPPGSPDLPGRWNFRVKLINLSGGRRLDTGIEASGLVEDLFLPAAEAPRTFTSPVARQSALGHEESMKITILRALADGERTRLEGEAVSSKASLREYRARDVVRIIPSSHLEGLEKGSLWGVMEDRTENGFRFTALVAAAEWATAEWKTPLSFAGSVGFFKRLHVPCDLYSLGMLLFRLFLVNDGQDLFLVEGAVQRVLNKLSDSFPGTAAGSPAGRWETRRLTANLTWLCEAEGDVFSSGAALYSRAEREGRINSIPPKIWSDLIILGFRLVSSIPGFSFSEHHADYSPEHPEGVMDKVLVELDDLGRRMHVELFGQTERSREIAEICGDLLASITQAELGGASEDQHPKGVE